MRLRCSRLSQPSVHDDSTLARSIPAVPPRGAGTRLACQMHAVRAWSLRLTVLSDYNGRSEALARRVAQESKGRSRQKGRWGSLAAFGARQFGDWKKLYGTRGNSFVAVVEFGDRVRARAVTAGGLNSVPSSAHFSDQTDRYATGDLRDVHFYRADVEANAAREYHPGG